MKTKRVIIYMSILILLVAAFTFCAVNADAAEETSSTCGETLNWTYNPEDNSLVIYGSGAIADYARGEYPWSVYAEEVTSLVFTVDLTYIPDYAFENMPIDDIYIPDGVTHIGYSAFAGTALKNLRLSRNLEHIGAHAFARTALQSVDIPDTVIKLGNSAFSSCKNLESVRIGSGVEKIPNSCFKGCSRLQSITIPDTVTEILESAFWECSLLSEVDFGSSVEKIGINAFKGCDFEKLILPDSLIEIGGYAFSECTDLISVTFGKNVQTLYGGAFSDCTRLSVVTLNDGLKKLIGSAFDGCTKLKSLTVPESVEQFVYDKYGWSIEELYVNSAFAIAEMVKEWDITEFKALKYVYFACDKTEGISCINMSKSVANVYTKRGVSYYEYNLQDGKEFPFSHTLEQSFDEYGHFDVCSVCGYESNDDRHEYVDYKIVRFSTPFRRGLKQDICECGYATTVVLPILKISPVITVVVLVVLAASVAGLVLAVKKKRSKTKNVCDQ